MKTPDPQLQPHRALQRRWEHITVNLNQEVSRSVWQEIMTAYSSPERFYHNLNHLQHINRQLEQVKTHLEHCESVFFAMFFHDVIYDVERQDNEEKSAVVASEKMHKLSLGVGSIAKAQKHIMATKSADHLYLPDSEYFVDADHSILGESPEIYSEYSRQVRREFLRFPDFLYSPGRRNVLVHFLEQKTIYHTQYFQQHFEAQARRNIQAELDHLAEH